VNIVRFGQVPELLVSHAAFGAMKVPDTHDG
jgi:hypothetical protein